jgi:hypothetical protein
MATRFGTASLDAVRIMAVDTLKRSVGVAPKIAAVPDGFSICMAPAAKRVCVGDIDVLFSCPVPPGDSRVNVSFDHSMANVTTDI